MKHTLQMRNGDVEHVIQVAIEYVNHGIQVVATYLSGSLHLDPQAVVARWPVRYERADVYFDGQVSIGDGRIEIEVPQLRRLGLGSLFMATLVEWVKTHPSVPVAPIDLKGDDARTDAEKQSRNRFYEKFGFVFDYQDNETWGTSRPMTSSDLIVPETKFPPGWIVECSASQDAINR